MNDERVNASLSRDTGSRPLAHAARRLGRSTRALADWLFLDCSLGLSLPLFLCATSLAALTANRPCAGARARFSAFAFLAIGLLALFEEGDSFIPFYSPSWNGALGHYATSGISAPGELVRDNSSRI